ncbi:sulfatase-like hydrolase/transferase [Streptomyces goshikiensis]|uniref:sulfatase-like hydrolase/transferase n=1 Tax=Streptomyces goshikiensis TaxID=1942 RepID=UPI0036601BCB
MSCYGGPIETPNIDRIAANGLRYSQWHTTALCSPTRSALLTGRNHTTNGMACISEAAIGFPGAIGHIPSTRATLAEILVEKGYSTALTGTRTRSRSHARPRVAAASRSSGRGGGRSSGSGRRP